MTDKNSKSFPSDEDAAEYLDKWSIDIGQPYPAPKQPIDYELTPGQSVPPTYKHSLWDRLWNWLRTP